MALGSPFQKQGTTPCQGIQAKNQLTFDQELDIMLGINSQVKIQNQENTHLMQKSLQIGRQKSQSNQIVFSTTQQAQSEKKQGKTVRKSNHHNLQKHTVTALKSIINTHHFSEYCEDSSIFEVVSDLWKQFISLKNKQLMTKKFLSILFRSDSQSALLLQNYSFSKIFLHYDTQQIVSAKNELRKMTIKFLSNSAIKQHVQNRQIHKKEQFRLYLEQFRNQLQEQNLGKRISKNRSNSMKVFLNGIQNQKERPKQHVDMENQQKIKCEQQQQQGRGQTQ